MAVGFMFYVTTDQTLCEELGISWNASTIFGVMKKLMVLSYIKKIEINNLTYTVLYRNMILQQIPHAPISTRTLSKILTELLDVGLLVWNDNHSTPAYAFTPLADKYISSTNNSNIQVPDIKNKKKPLFDLNKITKVTALTPEYYALLKQYAIDICVKDSISSEEFDKFVDHHNSKGNGFKNWLSAFRNWVRNYKKFNPNVGEDKNGMYV
ncbi:MAG: hypothetical protein NTW78_03950 [Campylobacterales bacterium]|nr:hypothetical protein [Campylobacterales bacterium]